MGPICTQVGIILHQQDHKFTVNNKLWLKFHQHKACFTAMKMTESIFLYSILSLGVYEMQGKGMELNCRPHHSTV